MIFSEDTEEVLKFLDYISGNNLRKREDLGTILETGASAGAAELINDIVFTGTYLWNVSSTLRRTGSGSEGINALYDELKRSGEVLRELLIEFTDMADEETKNRFNTVYLPMTAGAFRNLTDLAHDLAELKNLQNTMKNK